MKFTKEYSGVVALVILAIIWLSSLVGGSQSFGAAVDCQQVTCFTTVGVLTSLQVDGTFRMGSSGTALTNVVGTACDLIGTNGSQAATSTVAYDCAVAGVTSSDRVIAQLATSTPVGASSAWWISAAKASTTAGFVTVLLSHNGPAAVPSATNVGSSTSVWAFH